MKYLYYAIFHQNHKGQYEVSFPDLAPNAATYGEDMSDALKQAKDALAGYLLTAEDYREEFDKPSKPQDIEYDKSDLLIPIEVDTTIERQKEKSKSVKKTLTIPSYLNDLAKAKKINFSSLLTSALKQVLGIY